MTDRPRSLLGRGLLLVGKLAVLAAVAALLMIQIPELRDDLSNTTALQIKSPADLDAAGITQSTLVNIHAAADFTRGFRYPRYGLEHTYFLLDGYGPKIVVRTYKIVDDDWEAMTQFVGRLRPFSEQPFSYHIRDKYREKYNLEIPPDGYFLSLYDVPDLSGWSIAAVIFCALLLVALTYGFFLRKHSPPPPTQA